MNLASGVGYVGGRTDRRGPSTGGGRWASQNRDVTPGHGLQGRVKTIKRVSFETRVEDTVLIKNTNKIWVKISEKCSYNVIVNIVSTF